MAALPLSQTVDASARKRSWRSVGLSLLTSTLLQGGAITVLIVAPLLAMQTPPLPQNAASFAKFVPVVPPPPPAKRSIKSTRRPPTITEPSRTADIWHVPVETPDGIPDDVDIFGDSDAPGALDGVEGGLPGAPPALPIVTTPEPVEKAPSGPIEIGGEIRPPRKIHHVDPVYPRLAIHSRVEGEVAMRAIIDETGAVVNLSVVRSESPLLEKAALDAVSQWRYEPTLLNGKPVPIVMTVSVHFNLP